MIQSLRLSPAERRMLLDERRELAARLRAPRPSWMDVLTYAADCRATRERLAEIEEELTA